METPKASSDREVLAHLLGERVKELTALHDAARLLETPDVEPEELLDRIVALIPPAFQFPEITEARAAYGMTARATAGFAETAWMLSATFSTVDGTAGHLDVAYTAERPAAAEGPFLREERHLIESLADMVRSALDWRASQKALRKSEQQLAGALGAAEKQRDRVKLLLDLSNAVTSELDFRKLIPVISGLLRATVDHHYISLSLWDPEIGRLRRHGLVFPGGRGAIQDGELVSPDTLPAIAFAEGVTRVWREADIRAHGGTPLAIMEAEGLRCACCVPLQTSRARHGTLNVGRLEDRDYSADEIALLEQLARQIAIPIENALHYEQARRFERDAAAQRDSLKVLLDLNNAIASELDLKQLIPTISGLLRKAVDHHYISLTLWDEDAGTLRRHGLMFAGGTGTLQDGAIVPPGAPPFAAFYSGETAVTRWADVLAIGGELLEVMEAEGLRSSCCVPLHTPRARLGTLNVARPDDHAFSDDEIKLLERIAQQIAVPIENAQHFEQARRFEREAAAQRDRLSVLLEVANTLASERELGPLIDRLAHVLKATLPYTYAGLSLWEEESRRLRRYVVTDPGDPSATLHGQLVEDGYPASIVFARGETMIFSASDPQGMMPEAVRRLIEQTGLRSGCGVMIATARARHGVLTIGNSDERPYTVEELQLLEQIARQVAIAVDNVLAYQEISALKERLAEEKLYLEDELEGRGDFKGIIGSSQALSSVLHAVRTVAPTDATVLLLGETGTGKEVVARAIHDASRRQKQTFVRVNAAALPASLAESELFGYEKGAFTGAVSSKVGRLELAHRGTLFLDEIGDMPIDIQPKLLRALQEHEFERLGSTRTQKVDVRLVAATNRNLEEMVAAGTFRSDLYYRLSVFPIQLPPLRERPEDIPPLVRHFVQKFSVEMGRAITTIPAGLMQSLQKWSWPGNIRELQNVIERAVILSPGASLQLPPGALRRTAPTPAPAMAEAPEESTPAQTSALSAAERDAILHALREAGGIVGGEHGAAAKLGVKRTTLHSKMKKLGIERPRY